MRDVIGPRGFTELADATFSSLGATASAGAISGANFSSPEFSGGHLGSVVAPDGDFAALSVRRLPDNLVFPAETFKQIRYWYEPNERAVWCMTRQTGIPSFTRSLMDELTLLHSRIERMADPAHNEGAPAPLFYVGGSDNLSVFNVGGDLPFFVECIRRQDAKSLNDYARACIQLVHQMDHSLGGRVFTICVLEGDALGGGFEAAISFNHLIAERGVKLGLPESLFNAFPGMGAYSHLSRRLGPRQAREMILSGKLFDAEELFELGIVATIVDKGRGREAARDFLAQNAKKQPMLLAMEKVRRRVDPITLNELLDVAEIWVENSLRLGASELRRMELLAAAQLRRASARTATQT